MESLIKPQNLDSFVTFLWWRGGGSCAHCLMEMSKVIYLYHIMEMSEVILQYILPYFVKKVFSMSGKVLNSLLAVAQRSMEKLKVG